MRTRDKLAPAFDETSQFTDMSRPPRPLLDTVKVGVGEVKTVPPAEVVAEAATEALADHERARSVCEGVAASSTFCRPAFSE